MTKNDNIGLFHDLFLGFIKLHILHHAVKAPVYGLWLTAAKAGILIVLLAAGVGGWLVLKKQCKYRLTDLLQKSSLPHTCIRGAGVWLIFFTAARCQ